MKDNKKKVGSNDNKQSQNIKVPNHVALEMTIGAAILLVTKSESHKYFFSSELETKIIAPILSKQFLLMRSEKNEPIAFVTFADVDEEVEKRLFSGNIKLKPQDWKSGKNSYIIDIVSPFISPLKILDEANKKQFKDKKVKILKPTKNGMDSILLTEFLKENKAKESDNEK